MKIKTKWFGSITASEEELQKFKGILQDAAAYNLEKGYIKVHGDLMEEIKNINEVLLQDHYKQLGEHYERKSQRNLSATAQEKRSGSTGKTRSRKKQTGVHKESDNK